MVIFLQEINNPLIYDILSYYFNLGGKRMRPTLFYAISKSLGSQENLVPFSLALELIHTMSLYHDDVIDNATERRGAPTAHLKWDEATAIVGGDIFHGMIHRYLIDALRTGRINNIQGSLKFISDLIRDVELTIGTAVIMEMQQAKSPEIPPVEITIKIASEKTAPLFAFSASAAALLANKDKIICDNLYNMGMQLGYAFQLLDDIGDYYPSNKGIGNDLREDRKTPILSLCNEFDQLSVLKYRSKGSLLTNTDIIQFRKKFHKQFTIIIEWSSVALSKAENLLSCLPENEHKENVMIIIQMLMLKSREFLENI